jgi:UDP-glucose 4-epimerase
MHRFVITGAGGALGRALIARLEVEGSTILALDQVPQQIPDATFLQCDVAQARFSEILVPGDVVFHLAAFVHRAPGNPEEVARLHEVNHGATERLASACHDVGATLVFVSTVAVWNRPPVRPDAEPDPVTEYGKSKARAEHSVRDLGRDGLRYAIVRFPLLYGPRGRGNMERMLQAIGRRRYWPVGDPETPKSCLFLDDAARALVLAWKLGLGASWVAAPRVAPTLGEIHAAAYAAMNRMAPPPIPRGAALALARIAQNSAKALGRTLRLSAQVETLTAPAGYDGSAFAAATGFEPAVGLDEGMRLAARWLAQQGRP